LSRTAILFGILLIGVGVAGYLMGGDHKSPTALIPAIEGLLLVICGAIVVAKPAARKHAMHAAAMVGTLGFLAAAGRLVPKLIKGEIPATLPLTCLLLMIALSALFVFLCVRSFIAARRAREATA
jgi:hypothetical protein